MIRIRYSEYYFDYFYWSNLGLYHMAVAEVVALRDPMVTTMTALSLFAAGAVT